MPGFAFDLAEWFTKHAEQVNRDLGRYFGGKPGDQFTGRWFDDFAAVGDPNRFEASDIIAVEALNVEVPSEAASSLLLTDSERFNSLLREICPQGQKTDLGACHGLDVNVGSKADDLMPNSSPSRRLVG